MIGACIGIPLIIAGATMVIVGRIKYNKRVLADLQESVRAGVVQGMQPQASTLPIVRTQDADPSQSGPTNVN
jgi:hypothetical protein